MKQIREKGFTLIELVIVIVLIGILAATALPKFADLTGQANTAANQGVAGSLGTAVNIGHSAWVAAGGTAAISGVNLECNLNNIHVNASGWPDAASTCAGGATPPAGPTPTGDVNDCINVFQFIMSNPPAVAATGCTQAGCYNTAGTTATSCVYTRGNVSPTRSITYTPSTGSVTFTP